MIVRHQILIHRLVPHLLFNPNQCCKKLILAIQREKFRTLWIYSLVSIYLYIYASLGYFLLYDIYCLIDGKITWLARIPSIVSLWSSTEACEVPNSEAALESRIASLWFSIPYLQQSSANFLATRFNLKSSIPELKPN